MVRHPQSFAALDKAALGGTQEEFVGRAAPGGHSVRDVEVEETVPVHISDTSGEPVRRAGDSGGRGHVHEAAVVVPIEAVVIIAVPAVPGHVEVGVAVPVVVEKERGPPAARIEKPGIESRGREGRCAVLPQAVSVERVRIPYAEGQEVQIAVAVKVRPAAGPGPRPALDSDLPRDLVKTHRRRRAPVREVQPVALRQRCWVLAGLLRREHQVPARFEHLGLEIHRLAQRRRGGTGSPHPEQGRPQRPESGGAVGSFAQHHLEVGSRRRIVAEPQLGDSPPVILAWILAVQRDGAGEVIVGQPQARIAALDVGEPHVEVRLVVVRVQRDRVAEELDGAVVVAEPHHPEPVLEVLLRFLYANVGSAVLSRGVGPRQHRESQREGQPLPERAFHARDDTGKGRGPSGPRPDIG